MTGDLYLTNYKLFFHVNKTKFSECLKYSVPYGCIDKMTDEKSSCTISITCKDERTIKFKFENNFSTFIQTAKVIRNNCQQCRIEQLYCYNIKYDMSSL